MKYVKSPLNYTGGKYKLLPQIMPYIKACSPNYFIDLFAGGCNVVANVDARKRIANDVNKNVISVYERFQQMDIMEILGYIRSKIDEYGLSKANAEAYDRFRKDYNGSERKEPLDLFILICHSFNYQIRFNSKGCFNMPFGKNKSYFNDSIMDNLVAFHEAMKNVKLSSNDFRELKIDKLCPNDYVYCDPPYLVACASYNEQGGWDEKDERDLLALLDTLNGRHIRFGLSNVLSNKGKENEILRDWAERNKYNVHHLNYSYKNCNYHAKDKESITDEVLITNY